MACLLRDADDPGPPPLLIPMLGEPGLFQKKSLTFLAIETDKLDPSEK